MSYSKCYGSENIVRPFCCYVDYQKQKSFLSIPWFRHLEPYFVPFDVPPMFVEMLRDNIA